MSRGFDALLGLCVLCSALTLSLGCSKKVVRNRTVFGLDNLSMEKSEKSAENLKDKGIELAREKSFEKAIEALKEHTQKNLTDSSAYNALGISYKSLGDFSSAMNSFEKALNMTKQPEERSKILSNIGNLYYAAGKYQAALGFYKEAASESDQNPLYLIFTARTFVMLGDYERARKVISQIEEKIPRSAQHKKDKEDVGLDHYLLAEIFTGLNEEKKVYENIEKALKANPARFVAKLSKDMQNEENLFFTLQGDKRIQKMLNRFGSGKREKDSISVVANP
ncbi:MAG: tetratricopeptide repeat protein [Pseudomonadota bacterium]